VSVKAKDPTSVPNTVMYLPNPSDDNRSYISVKAGTEVQKELPVWHIVSCPLPSPPSLLFLVSIRCSRGPLPKLI